MLNGSKTLLKTSHFHFQLKHLLVIGVLAISFSTAFIIRSYPIKYGYFLNEFDPYFDYRATKYIVDHGLGAYLSWHDKMSWYPEGRNVPATSQTGLHIVAAYLYEIFGAGSSLLDFVIIFPVVMGSLTTVAIFALVRTLKGTSAGLFASLLFAFTPAIIQRGNLGWFKSEPLGLFFGITATYLFVSAIKSRQVKIAILKAILAGFLLGLANASWGGIQYFAIPISIFFIALPFFRKDLGIPLAVAICITTLTLITAGIFPRPGISFVFGLPGIALMGGSVFLAAIFLLRRFTSQEHNIRNSGIVLGVFVAIAVGVMMTEAYYSPSFRYLNAINPFLSAQNPLTASVAEHFTPTIVDYFIDYSILMMFAGFGIWMAFRKRNDMTIFALILGFTGLYVSATFARLLVFSSISIIVLASMGLFDLTRIFMERYSTSGSLRETRHRAAKGREKRRIERLHSKASKNKPMVISFAVVLIFLLTVPMFYPSNVNWVSSADVPPSIANGGTGYRLQVADWIDALDWISKNTPKNSVVAAWWDYGYWITTIANRTSLADNATINQTRIADIAKMFIEPEREGYEIAKELHSDYIVLYLVGQRFPGGNGTSFYTLGSGGDESKKQWFIRIGGFNEPEYLEQDGFTPTPKFWNDTLLGKLMPLTPQAYASIQGGQLAGIQPTYQPGTIALYTGDLKYPPSEEADQPFSLVYASPSFLSNTPGLVFGVLVYKVNQDYQFDSMASSGNNSTGATRSSNASITGEIQNATSPSNGTSPQPSASDPPQSANPSSASEEEVAVIKTTQGPITIEFLPQVAPNHVANFKKLAQEGFYNDTVFHRIISNFMIQGGDPNTKGNDSQRERWGTGGPGYNIDEEFNDVPHARGIVSMARSSDPNSAGSQFFIVSNDSLFLDGQYTAFGRVIQGMDTVDKVARLPTTSSFGQADQPTNPNDARIIGVNIVNRSSTSTA
jgi:dolichyl-diphosphooligosaccharide---protein glycosyltransferase